ncbi:MAG TPA: lysylphosphatidylglycerol synthase transmembrane domain-containing protein [Candidatus Saccharimonadales bacterium]
MTRADGSRANHAKRFHPNRPVLVLLGAAVLLLYIVVPQVGFFRHSLGSWRHADLQWLIAALASLLFSYCLAAGVYTLLAWKHVRYWLTAVVQAGGMFANRLLPAGAGALGVNYLYLRRQKHTRPQALAVVALNNLAGFVGNMVVLVVLVFTTHSRLRPLHLPPVRVLIYVLVAIVIVCAVLALWRKLRRMVWLTVVSTAHTIAAFRNRPGRLALSLIISMLLAICYAFCLFACARALHLYVPFPVLFIVMTVGVAGGVVVPTPGGLGGTEAGLVASLIVYGVSSEYALALALLYRLFTFWLPLLFGAVAFIYVERRRYI